MEPRILKNLRYCYVRDINRRKIKIIVPLDVQVSSKLYLFAQYPTNSEFGCNNADMQLKSVFLCCPSAISLSLD